MTRTSGLKLSSQRQICVASEVDGGRRRVQWLVACAAAVVMAGCASDSGHGASGAVTDPTPSTAASGQAAGQTIGALDARGIQGVAVALDGTPAVMSAADGSFVVQAKAGDYHATLSGAGIVERRTMLRVPSASAQLSLMPMTFDLTSFDQMFRQSSARLQRWTKAPALVIVAADLAYTAQSSLTAASYEATGARVSDADINAIRDDLSAALPQMTGDVLAAFASVSIETPAAGAVVNVQRDGVIVAGRLQGLQSASSYAGYGRSANKSDGTVTAGSLFIDADVDRAAPLVRSALHAHEMGHALGYSHVAARTSVMNASPAVTPNDADRAAARVAFQRAPGSRTPDIDPDAFVANAASIGSPAVWGPPQP